MRRLMLPCALALSLATPSLAQEAEGPGLMERGLMERGLMERGMSMFFEGLIGEVAPELDKMQQALQDMQPQMEKLVDLMGDVQHYEAPERLPNGDVLIRRKAGAPPPPALPEAEPQTPPAGSTDL